MMAKTRYLVFTRVNPTSGDYVKLLDVADKIDACLKYKTVMDGAKYRLVGFLVLRGRPTYAADIGRLLPNFNVTFLSCRFDDGYDWIGQVRLDGGVFVDGPVFQNYKDHPFVGLKRALFDA